MALSLGFTEWYRRHKVPVAYYAQQAAKRTLIDLFGHTLTDNPAGARPLGIKFPAFDAHLSENRGRVPLTEFWAQWFPLQPTWVPPELGDRDKATLHGLLWREKFCGDTPLVLLFPKATFRAREWPHAYWLDLAWGLEKAGVRTVTFVPSEEEKWSGTFPYRIWGAGWDMIVSLMLSGDLIVGNDSGPCHLAGILNRPAFALCGPSVGVFTGYGSVEELRDEATPCVGCCFRAGYRAACDVQCQALMRLTPDRVITRVLETLDAGRPDCPDANLGLDASAHGAGGVEP